MLLFTEDHVRCFLIKTDSVSLWYDTVWRWAFRWEQEGLTTHTHTPYTSQYSMWCQAVPRVEGARLLLWMFVLVFLDLCTPFHPISIDLSRSPVVLLRFMCSSDDARRSVRVWEENKMKKTYVQAHVHTKNYPLKLAFCGICFTMCMQSRIAI